MFESAPHTPPSPRVETRLKPHDARDNRVQAGGNATGVTIVHRMTNEAEYEHESNFILGLTPIDTPGKAILTALIGSLGVLVLDALLMAVHLLERMAKDKNRFFRKE